jgi:hypothetical protein
MARTDSEFWEYVKEYRNSPFGWWLTCARCGGAWTPSTAEGCQSCLHCGHKLTDAGEVPAHAAPLVGAAG